MRVLIWLMLAAAPLWAAEVKVPAEIKLKVGRLGKIEATATDPKVIRWINLSPDLDVIESETGRYATVLPVKAGTYKIALYSDAGGPPSYCTIIAGDPPPPVPPDPPTPPPDDALTAALRAAYALDTEADKADLKARLAALYRQGAKIAEDRRAGETVITSWGQWRMAMAAAGIGRDKLPNTQAAASKYLTGRVPNVAAQALGDEVPAAVAALRAAAAAMEAVK